MTVPLRPVETVARGPGRPRDEAASRAIFDAALHQLERLGYGRMTVESVAAEAGVSRASVYRRFRDKADLVTAAIAQANDHLDDNADDRAPVRDPRRALIEFLEEFDARFAESCLEVIGGLVGAREDPTALAMHRQRVVAPRPPTGARCSRRHEPVDSWRPMPTSTSPSRCSPVQSCSAGSAVSGWRRVGHAVPWMPSGPAWGRDRRSGWGTEAIDCPRTGRSRAMVLRSRPPATPSPPDQRQISTRSAPARPDRQLHAGRCWGRMPAGPQWVSVGRSDGVVPDGLGVPLAAGQPRPTLTH